MKYLITSALLVGAFTLSAAGETRLTDGWTFKRSTDLVAELVTVPHCWNAIDGADGAPSNRQAPMAEGGYWRGLTEYKRTLDIKPTPGKRYFLRCEGASEVAKVYLNGVKLGEHIGAFGAFCFELTPYLKEKDNALTITVDNSVNYDIPPISGDFTLYGGLYRPVTLFETGDFCINRANKFSTPGVLYKQTHLTDDQAILQVATDLSGTVPAGARMKVTMTQPDGKETTSTELNLTPGSTALATAVLRMTNPTRWDGVNTPYLYTVTTQLLVGDKVVDEHIGHWGFRTAEIDTTRGFVLNGRAFKVHGVNRHQDRDGKGWAISDADHEEDFKIMREMGADAWRAAHYPHATKAYEICDRLGMIVWAEIPVVNYCNATDTHTANAKFMLEEMIRQHQNHPSILMWGLSNELGNGPRSAVEDQLMKDLPVMCEQLDPTRLCVIAASRFREENYNVKHFGFNIYPGWYGYTVYDMGKIIKNWSDKHPGQGISVSEYGAGGSICAHEYPYPLKKVAKVVSPWHTEEYQTHSHEQHYKGIKESGPVCWGSFLWNMYDFGADHRKEGDRFGTNDKGLVSFDRKTRKDAFYFYQANWTTAPMVHITSRRFTERPATPVKHADYGDTPVSALEMPFKVFSNCDEVELFLDGKSIGTKKPDDMATAVFPSKLEPGKRYTIEAVAKKDGKTVKDSYTFQTLTE